VTEKQRQRGDGDRHVKQEAAAEHSKNPASRTRPPRIGLSEIKAVATVAPALFKTAPSTGDTVKTVKLDSLEIHPLALAFPEYRKEDFEKLTNDIRNQGLRQPITLFEGRVLDGRNRVEAMKKAGKISFEGTFEEARAYVVSMNDIRRHLTTSQRAAVAAELATLPRGGDRSKPQNCGLPTRDAAKQLKVSPRSVETAKAVKKADPALGDTLCHLVIKFAPLFCGGANHLMGTIIQTWEDR
jgi:hypothetical protein